MIFSNRKNESSLEREVLVVLEGLDYLNQRARAFSDKIQHSNPQLFPAADCLTTMANKIEKLAFKSSPGLNLS